MTGVHYKLHPANPMVRLDWKARGDNLESDAFRRFHRQWLEYWVRKAPKLDDRWGGTWSDRGCSLYFSGNYWDAFVTLIWDFSLWCTFKLDKIPFLNKFFKGFSVEIPILSTRKYENWYDARGGPGAYRNPDRTTRTGYTDWFYGARLVPHKAFLQSGSSAR